MRPPARAAAIDAVALHSSNDHHVAVLAPGLTCAQDRAICTGRRRQTEGHLLRGAHWLRWVVSLRRVTPRLWK